MSLRVASLNIWNRMGPWEERLAAIRAQLPTLDADIVGLQEVLALDDDSFHQGELVGEGRYQIVYGRHADGPYPMGNAILSRWPVLDSRVMHLPREGTDEHRTVIYALLDAPFGRVPVFCTHLNWKFHEGHVRAAQVRFVADRIAELAPPDAGTYPPILLGDFNAVPDADEIRFLRGLTGLGGPCVYFADTFGTVGSGDGTTYARRNPFAAVLREPDRRIDYIFVRGPDEQGRGEPLEARVCFDQPHEGTFPSDHFGLLAVLST